MNVLTEYLESHSQEYSVEIDAFAKYTFHMLPQQELQILIDDVKDEIIRRQNQQFPFLPILMHLPPNRNQARQKLATLGPSSFYELCFALYKVREKQREKLTIEIKNLEQKATARSMDRQRNGSAPLNQVSPNSVLVVDSSPTNLMQNEPPKSAPLLKQIPQNDRDLLNENKELKKMVELKVLEIDRLNEKVNLEISKRFELELKLQEPVKVDQGVQVDCFDRVLAEKDKEIIDLKKKLEQLSARDIDQSTGSIRSKEQESNPLETLASECKENGKKLLSAMKIDKKSVIPLTKTFLLSCKKISDESERLDNLELLSKQDSQCMAIMDARLADDLCCMMECVKIIPVDYKSVIEKFEKSTLDTLETIHEICNVLNRVYHPVDAIHKRLERYGEVDLALANSPAVLDQPMTLKELKVFQLEKMRALVALQGTGNESIAKDLVNVIMNETRATLNSLDISAMDLKRIENVLEFLKKVNQSGDLKLLVKVSLID